MSPALNRSSAIRRFEGSDAIEIRDGITFDFYTGLPHMPNHLVYASSSYTVLLYCNTPKLVQLREIKEIKAMDSILT